MYNRNRSKDAKQTINRLLGMATKDDPELNNIDYQELLKHSIICSQNKSRGELVYFIKEYAESNGFVFDFVPLLKLDIDLRLIYQWICESCEACEANQIFQINCQKMLEKTLVELPNYSLLEFYLDRSVDLGQRDNLDFGDLIQLCSHNNDYIDLIKSYIPEGYILPDYPAVFEINVTDDSVMIDLIQYCYKTTVIDHIVYDGRKYYQRSNMWGDEFDIIRSVDDPDIECRGYHDCEVLYDIIPENPNYVKYVLNYDPDETVLTEDCYVNRKLIARLQNGNWENIKLVGTKRIVLHNASGENLDHRGSTHCKVKLDFYKMLNVDCPITLKEFFEELYRLKSHKWDYWYELYSSCTTKLTRQQLNVVMHFDHGS